MFQQTTLVGRLGTDPELRSTQTGRAVGSFSLAVTQSWVDKAGARQEKTLWFRVTTWDKQAETCQRSLAKGSKVMVVGELGEPHIYTDRSGEVRASMELTGRNVIFMDTREYAAGQGRAAAQPEPKAQGQWQQSGLMDDTVTDEDVPF